MPLPLACDLVNQSEAAAAQQGTAMTFVPCTKSSYIGYLAFASGPDLCTLSMPFLTCTCVTVLWVDTACGYA